MSRCASAILLTGLIGACSAPPRAIPTPDPTATAPQAPTSSLPAAPAEPYDLDAEGRFPPAPIVPPHPARGWRDTLDIAVAPSEPSRAAPAPAVAAEAQSASPRSGYRVQVAACRTLDIAQGVRADVTAVSESPVYIEHEPPYYKVRVGDCSAKSDCNQLASQLRATGWESAWVVRTQIESP